MRAPAEQIVWDALETGIRHQINIGELGMAFVVAGILALSDKQPMDALAAVDRIIDECRAEQLQRTPSKGSA